MKSFRTVILAFFLICIAPFSTADMNCDTHLSVDRSGDGFQSVLIEDSLKEDHKYPEGAEWHITVPKRSENVNLESNANADLRVTEDTGNKKVYMTLSEDFDKDAQFNISVELPRAATIYEDQLYLEQSFLMCSGQNSVRFKLPSSFDVESIDHSYEKNGREIVLSPLTQNRITLEAQTDIDTAGFSRFETSYFTVKAPETYENYIRDITQEAESYNENLESSTGLENPEKLNITYIAPSEELGFAEGSGKFTPPNNIQLSSKLISRHEIHLLETLVHETAHSYSQQMLEGEDWWWEEGSVEYITYNALESNGHDVSIFEPSREEVQKTFENCFEKSFINNWNPIESDDRSCENGLGYNNLGYDHSHLIVRDMVSKDSDLIREAYSRMEDQDVRFTPAQDEMDVRPKNNQINYFTSQAAGEDLTNFLRNQGVETVSWQQPKQDLDETRNQIESLEDDSRYQIFEEELEELEDLYDNFYNGLYEQETSFSTETSEILSDAREKNREYNSTILSYRATEEQIEALENSEEPRFYTKSVQQLEEAENHIKRTEFGQAEKMISQASETANKTSSQIDEYRQRQEDLISDLENQNLLLSPFMFKSEEIIQSSEDSFFSGELEQALDEVESAENYKTYGVVGAAIFYILTILLLVWLWRRFNV